MHQAEFAGKVQPIHAEYRHLSLFQRVRCHAQGQHRHAKAAGGRIHQRQRAGGFPYRRDRETRGRGRAVELLAGAAAFFAQQKALDAEGVQRHGLALRKGTARRADDGQSIRHIFLCCQRTAVDRPFHQSDVQRVVQQLFLKLLRRPHPDAHIHPGVCRAECVHITGQELGADGNAGSYAQHALFVPAAQALFQVVEQAADVHRVFPHAPPGLGEIQAATDTVEQAHTVIFLQLGHGAAYGRLRQVQRPRRAGGVVAVFAHGQKNADVPQRHAKISL